MDPGAPRSSTSDATNIWVRGHDVTRLMQRRDVHRHHLPAAPRSAAVARRAAAARRHPDWRGGPRRRRAVVRRGAAGGLRQPAVALGGGRRRHPDDRRRARRRRLELHGADRRGPRAGRAPSGLTLADAAQRDSSSAGRRATSAGCRASAIACTPRDPRVAGALRHGRATTGSPATASASCARSKRRRATRIKPLPMNIDGALAAVLHDLGFTPPAGRFSSSSAASPG